MVLHELDEGRDGLAAEVLEVAARERVGLVDEQHAADGAVDDLRDLEGRLADVARDEVRARRLDEVALGDDAEVPYSRPMIRATVVLPVPGGPVNTRWLVASISGRPAARRARVEAAPRRPGDGPPP